MLNNALRICEAEFGNLFLYEDGAFREVSNINAPQGFEGFLKEGPIRPGPGTEIPLGSNFLARRGGPMVGSTRTWIRHRG
jgi:hypothetical protein